MSLSIKCPKCFKYGGCICHRGQWVRRFLPFLFANKMFILCHYCGYEWKEIPE